MSIRERRRREKQNLRCKILTAARQMFARDGYESVTMRKLAKEIEYSPTAIYLHFKDKDALVQELCIDDLSAMSETFQNLSREITDPIARVKAATTAFVKFGLAHPAQYQVVFMMPKLKKDHAETHPLAASYQFAYDHLRETFDELLRSGKLKSEFNNADLAAQIYFCGLHGIIASAIGSTDCRPNGWQSAERQADYFIKVFLAGLTKT